METMQGFALVLIQAIAIAQGLVLPGLNSKLSIFWLNGYSVSMERLSDSFMIHMYNSESVCCITFNS